MNRVRSGVQRLIQLVRRHRILSVIALAVVSMSLIGGIAMAAYSNDTSPKQRPTVAEPKKVQGAATTTATTEPTPQAAATATPATSDNKPAAPKPAATTPASKRQLKISLSTTSVSAGERIAITVQTDDGKPVAMPMFANAPPTNLLLNFAAVPTKTVWSGELLTTRFSKPGTYTIGLFAQGDKGKTDYRGTITITVLPSPIMTVAFQQVDYDEEYDAMIFEVTGQPQYGYAHTVERIFGYSFDRKLECYGEPVDEYTFVLACAALPGPRPTTGTVQVNVFTTNGEVFSGSTSYNLPQL